MNKLTKPIIEYKITCSCVSWKKSKQPRGCFTAWYNLKPKAGMVFCKALQEAGLGGSKEQTLKLAKSHLNQK